MEEWLIIQVTPPTHTHTLLHTAISKLESFEKYAVGKYNSKLKTQDEKLYF